MVSLGSGRLTQLVSVLAQWLLALGSPLVVWSPGAWSMLTGLCRVGRSLASEPERVAVQEKSFLVVTACVLPFHLLNMCTR